MGNHIEEMHNSPAPSRKPAKVAIVTDSVAQVPKELAADLGIRVIPFFIHIEDKKYLDGIDLDLQSLYRRMRQEKDLHPTTAAPSVGHFYNTFLECLEGGAESVLYLGVSTRLSATFSSAEGGANLVREQYPERQIILFDTLLGAIPQGFLAIEAARLAVQGASIQQIIEQVRMKRQRVGILITLETLEYLARGGRIGKAAYMLSSAIHILPLITLGDDGAVSPVGRVRGHHRAMERIVDYVAEKASTARRLTLTVLHSDALEAAQEMQIMAVERMHPDEIFIALFTPVIAAHTGPGTLGLGYSWDP